MAPEREKIVQMRLMGKSARQISRETGRDRETIQKIVAQADLPAYVEKLRERFCRMGDDALTTVHKRIKTDADFAYKFLVDIGVIPRGDTIPIKSPMAELKPVSAELRDQLLEATSDKAKIKFRLLAMAESRNDAYGLPPESIEFIPGAEERRNSDDDQEQET